MRNKLIALALAGAAGLCAAQLSTPDPDWKESEAPAPAALKTDSLIPVEIERTDLRWGVDPASVVIGTDRVVRYVVVARSESGAVNALYEGVRCNTGEVKVFARHAGGGWVQARDADWQRLQGNGPARHSLVLARNAMCIGNGTNTSAEQIVRDLRSSANTRFSSERR